VLCFDSYVVPIFLRGSPSFESRWFRPEGNVQVAGWAEAKTLAGVGGFGGFVDSFDCTECKPIITDCRNQSLLWMRDCEAAQSILLPRRRSNHNLNRISDTGTTEPTRESYQMFLPQSCRDRGLGRAARVSMTSHPRIALHCTA